MNKKRILHRIRIRCLRMSNWSIRRRTTKRRVSVRQRRRRRTNEFVFFISERRNFGSTGFRNAYESFRRSRDESLTRNSSRKSDEKPSMNSSLPPISDEFFNILANFDRPIVIQLKGIYKQVKENKRDFKEKQHVIVFFTKGNRSINWWRYFEISHWFS